MLRYCLLLFSMVLATSAAGGCRSCSNCHDYGPPVAHCCDACGTHRAGSASGEFIHSEYAEDGYYEPQPADEETPAELSPPQSIDLPSTDQHEGVR